LLISKEKKVFFETFVHELEPSDDNKSPGTGADDQGQAIIPEVISPVAWNTIAIIYLHLVLECLGFLLSAEHR